jgi:hypothetical protein
MNKAIVKNLNFREILLNFVCVFRKTQTPLSMKTRFSDLFTTPRRYVSGIINLIQLL